jgi:serine/threonine protein kinase
MSLQPTVVEILEFINGGSFGAIHRAMDQKRQPLAVKRIDLKVVNLLEPVIMASVVHPYLNPALRIVASEKELLIFQELASTNLHHWRETHKINLELFCRWTIQLIKGVQCLHQLGFIHGDIKAENVLIFNQNLKLTDFGKVTPVNSVQTVHGTQTHTAPEIYLHKLRTTGIDVFSLGCLLWFLYYGELLFPKQKTEPRKAHFNALLDWEKTRTGRQSYYHHNVEYQTHQSIPRGLEMIPLGELLLPLLSFSEKYRGTLEEALETELLAPHAYQVEGYVCESTTRCLCNQETQHTSLLNCLLDQPDLHKQMNYAMAAGFKLL